MQLSPHFSLDEMIASNTAARRGIDNMPNKVTLEVLRHTCGQMEKVRDIIGAPIIVSSGYRSLRLNDAVGGSRTSDHTKALAVDFNAKGVSISEVIKRVRKSDLEFDQLIDEFSRWVHIGFGPRMRRQVLSARSIAGTTRYTMI